MKKNKSVINTNKIAKKINFKMNEEVDVLKKIGILKENIKYFDNKTSEQIIKRIIKLHQEVLKQIGTKMEFYKLTDNHLSYHSSEIAFKKENDLLTRLKTELTYFNMASQGIDKMLKRYPKPVLKLSKEEQQLLYQLTNDYKLFDFYELKGSDKITRLEQIKIEVMLPLKQARRIIKSIRIKEKNNQDISILELEEKENAYIIKKICNYFIQYIDSLAIYEYYKIKKQDNQNKKLIDDYVLTKENKDKLKYFITDEDDMMSKEDLIFCFQYILYKGSISNMLPILYDKKDILFSKLDEKEKSKILNSFLDIIKYRKGKLAKDSLDRKLLKDLEEEYKRQIRLHKKIRENEEEKWCRLVKMNKDNKSLNMFCEAIKENPHSIFLKHHNKTYFEFLLETYFNFILNKKKGFSKEEETRYNNEKNYYEKLLLTSLYELKYENKGDYLKIMIEYYYNHFLIISDKNDLSLEHKEYVLENLKKLLNVFNDTLNSKENDLKKDLSSHYIMTIDSDSTKICEDAFSILEKDNTFECVLYVMDVVHFFPFDEEVESKFLTNQRIISKNQKKMLSLNQGRKKNTIAYIFELDKNSLKILDFKVQKEQIIVNKNYTFTEINQLLKGEDLKNKERIDNIINFLKKVNIEDFKINLNEASSILESLIIMFQTMYGMECERLNYPILYNNIEVLEDEEQLYYSAYRFNKLRLSLTSPVRKFDSYLNQLLSIWYFVQKKVENSNDLEKAFKFVNEYVEILNSKQKIKYKNR